MSKENFKELIVEKIDKITREYNNICINYKNDLNYINICTYQYNSMKNILEELLNDIEIMSEVKE